MFRQNNFPKHVELTGIINKPLLLHLVGCLYYLYQWCTIKQIPDNEIYLLIKYIKSVVWRVVKRLSYIEDARFLKVKLPCGTCFKGRACWEDLVVDGRRVWTAGQKQFLSWPDISSGSQELALEFWQSDMVICGTKETVNEVCPKK